MIKKAFISILLILAASYSTSGAEKKMNPSLTLLNIAPFIDGYEKEITEDILNMYKTGVITGNAFSMSLVPEGDPPVNKGELFAQKYKKFRNAIGKTDMPVGILLQSTMGHGWTPSAQSKFQKIRIGSGVVQYIFCPLDDDFLKYIYDTVAALAKLKPDFFMLDDDTRMLTGRNGCFCDLHIARFNRENNTAFDQKSMRNAVEADREIAKKYNDLMKRSMLRLAKTVRDAIDSVDKNIHCSFCICNQDVEYASEMAQILSAPGHDLLIRINHGLYLKDSPRQFTSWLWHTARQIHSFPKNVRLLAEPDTFPHNNYSTSAAVLHFHLSSSIISGCKGGKMWLTRTSMPELSSGRRYREKLSRFRKFYNALSEIEPDWQGVISVLPSPDYLNFPQTEMSDHNPDKWPRKLYRTTDNNWMTQIFGKMGIPFRFALNKELKNNALVALSKDDCDFLSDTELKNIFDKCQVILDGGAVCELVKRNFNSTIGVKTAVPISGKSVALETLANGKFITDLNNCIQITPADNAEIISRFYHKDSLLSAGKEYISPGAIRFTSPGGNQVISFGATINPFNHTAFNMLNETRKEMLCELINSLDKTIFYIVSGDDEIMFRYGKIPGYDFIYAANLSLDEIPELVLYAKDSQNIKSVEFLDIDGKFKKCPFSVDNGKLYINFTLKTISPAAFRIKR